MENLSPLRNWRLRLLWLRALLVSLIGLALLLLLGLGHSGYSLSELGWLGALLLPSLITLATRRSSEQRQLLTLELALDTLLFTALLQGFGGAGNPLSFYLLVPALLAALTLPWRNTLLVAGLALAGYMVSLSWYHMPAMNSPLHALSNELSGLHGIGMATVFTALLVTLTLLGQTIQQLMRQQQRQQQQALNLAGRREHMYQIAATLADQAHELNTPLGTLVMLADNLLHAPALPAALHQDVQQMEQLARNVANRLKQGREPRLDRAQPLSELLTRLELHLRHLTPTLQLTRELDFDPTLSDSESWFRVLCNLGYNAMDAGATRLRFQLQQQGDDYHLQVSDNGPAHPDSERQGMGIGLTLITTTLAQLRGELDMDFAEHWTHAHIHWPGNLSQGGRHG